MYFIEFSNFETSENDTPKERRNKEHKAALSLCKSMLKKYFNIENPNISISDYGKPLIDGRKVFFNISHSDNLVCCVVCPSDVGVDIEKLKNTDTDFIKEVTKRFFVESESKFIEENDFSEKAFLTVWTRKEAHAKMLGLPLLKCMDYDTFSSNDKTFENNGYIISICEKEIF